MARATVRQVAERAGVSTMTVSRIVRGQHDVVSPEKRALVLDAIRELDYVPVRPAFQNRHYETHIIGLVVDEIFSHKGLVAPHTLDGVRDTAFALGYDVLLMRSRPVATLDEQKSQLLDRRCDGFIFVSPRERHEVFEKLVQHGFPTVSCYSEDVPEGIAWVVPDNHGAVRQAVLALRQQGHQRIAYVAGPHQQSAARHRCEAYIETMQNLGMTPLWLELAGHWETEKAAAFVQQKKATAAICHSDYWAFSLWDHLNGLGLRVPEDVSLVGIDNIPDAERRGLTTFVNPYEKIGQTAVESLIDLLKGGDVQEACHTLTMTMVNRTSIVPPHPS
jgi:LacI family transcriptional regulator